MEAKFRTLSLCQALGILEAPGPELLLQLRRPRAAGLPELRP